MVFGYVRHIEESLQLSIPRPIIHLCVSFFQIDECFVNGNHLYYQLDESGKTVTVIKDCCKIGCWGNVAVPSLSQLVHVWTFKIWNKKPTMVFGVTTEVANKKAPRLPFHRNKESSNYSLMYMGYKWSNGVSHDYRMDSITSGDTLKMELNLKPKQLIFYQDDKCIGPAFSNIDTGKLLTYRMAVYFRNRQTKIELLEYVMM